MKNVLTVMKKEFARFFGDRRMIITALVPAVLIYALYSFMGIAMNSMLNPDTEYSPWIHTVDMPDSISQVLTHSGISLVDIEASEVKSVKEMITQKQGALCVVIFPPNFDEQVAAYDVLTAQAPAPNIEIFFNSTVPNSQDVYHRVTAALDAYEDSLSNKFDINRDVESADIAKAEDLSAELISMVMPMLLIMFLFSGCMGLALESITGEKERGTLATLLVTPLKRSELAVGKILSLAVLSFLSGLVTAVATILALPNLAGGAEGMIDAGIYSATDYIYLAMVILSTLLLLVAAISIVSAFSKTVKEANAAVMPLMIIVMLVGVTGMFGGGAATEPIYYAIPIYNSVQSMSGVFSLNYSAINIAISCLSNLVFACAGGYALTKMFNSEKVMFS